MADGEAYVEIPDDSSAANRIKQVSHELRRLGLLSKQPAGSGHADIQPEDEDPVVPLSCPLNCQGGSNTATFDIATVDDEDCVEITLDISDDSVTVASVKPGCGGDTLARTLERQEQRRLASLSERTPGGGRVDRSKLAAGHALQGLKFIRKTDEYSGWLAVEKRFDDLAKDGSLPKSLFSQCIGMKESEEFAGELFEALAKRRNITGNSINKMEMREFWDQISDQSFDSRLQTFFDMVDKNADGRITEEEVKEFISMSASTNRLSNIRDQAEEYARLFMEELDPDNLGYIEIYNLETLLTMGTNDSHGHSDIQDNKTLKKQGGCKSTRFNIPESSSAAVVPPSSSSAAATVNDEGINPINRSALAIAHTLKVLKFTSKTDEPNGWLAVEKRFDELANDGMLPKSLFSHCIGMKESKEFAGELFDALARRRNITGNSINKMELKEFWDQISDQSFDSRIQTFLDMVDKNADGKITELEVKDIIFMSASANGQSKIQVQAEEYARLFMEELDPNNLGYIEIYNLETLLRMGTTDGHGHSDIQYKKLLKKQGGRKSTYFNIPESSSSTVAPESLSAAVVPQSSSSVVATANDEVTGRIDMSKWPVVHALKGLKFTSKSDWSNGWLDRALRSSVRPVKIIKVAVYPENVLALHVSKPQGFRYRSGQYMFVNGKAFSPFEWHPFFITSAPLDDYISVCIKTMLGDSTRQLKTLFSGFCQPSTGGKSGLLRADYDHSGNSLDPSIPKVLIDGPYGAFAQDYKKYEVVLLIGLGYGVAPFISIIKDIINNLKELDSESLLNGGADIEHGGTESNRLGETSFKTRRAYFYWVTRDQGSFEWFKGVLNEVAESDKKGAIELHNYCTSVYKEGDARSALIAMLQSLNYAKHGVDVVSGTTVKSHFAHPNWGDVYKKLALNHPSQRVGVFYYGTPVLIKELRELALDFSGRTNTKFDFHKENSGFSRKTA